MSNKISLLSYSKESLYETVLLATLILCGLYVRVGGWQDFYFFTDDVWHLVIAKQNSLLAVLKANLVEDVHPPVSYIILYYMLKVSSNEYFLRCISLIPGVVLIPMIYLLGKERLGIVAGTVMAFLVTFGEWTTLISGAIRGYSLMTLCVTYALWAMYRFDRTCLYRYVAGYFIAMFMAQELVHSTIFFIIATGSWWFFKNVCEKSRRKFLIWWVIGHGGLLACLLLYMALLKQFSYAHVVYGYFPSGLLNGAYCLSGFYAKKLLIFIQESSSTVNDGVFLAALLGFCIGTYMLIVRRMFDIIYLFFCTFWVIVAADYTYVYPFSNFLRHIMFLVVPFYLILGAVCQSVGSAVLSAYQRLETYENRRYCLREIDAEKSIGIMLSLCLMVFGGGKKRFIEHISLFARVMAVLVISVCCSIFVATHHFYRATSAGVSETSMRKPVLEGALKFLSDNVGPHDIIITSAETTWYLRYLFDHPVITPHNPYVSEMKVFPVPLYFDGRPARQYNEYIDTISLQLFLKSLKGLVDFSQVQKIWFLHLGWQTDMISKLVYPEFISRKYTPYCSSRTEMDMYPHLLKEQYDLSWKFILSKAVSPRWARYDISGAAVVYGVESKFVNDTLINASFVDMEKSREDLALKVKKERFSYGK